MNKFRKIFYLVVVLTSLQGCASSGGAGQPSAPINHHSTTPNMNYMYSSPSYEMAHMPT